MRPGRLAAAGFLVLLTAGCIGVPSGSRVMSGNADGAEQAADDPYVRIIPVGPGRDWDPERIVRGFRTAASSFDGPGGEHLVARGYLACASCWRPGVAATVYDGSPQSVVETNGDTSATVTLEGTSLGRISADGQYVADTHHYTQNFRLRRDAQRQWRITDAPSELLLSRDDVSRAFRTFNLYFFAPDGQVLVPNPVFIPLVNRPWLSTQLVKQLIGGPTTWLKGAAVRSAFPAGTHLRGLTVDKGVATVDLSRQARAGRLQDMSIQLMWTLRQLRDVRQMKLEIEGETVRVPGTRGTLQSIDDWRAYDPNGSGDPQPAYVRHNTDGMLARLGADGLQPNPSKVPVEHPAISYDNRRVAALNAAENAVTVTDLATGRGRVVLRARSKDGRFTAPSWDTRNYVWVVESDAKGSRLWVIEGGTRPVALDGWVLSDHPVKALRVSRDGTRAAAIVQLKDTAQIQLGRIDKAPAPASGLQAEGFIAISSELKDAMDLSWSAADHLAVVGTTAANPTPLLYDVPVSGAAIRPMLGPGGDMMSIAAFPGSPLLVTQRGPGGKGSSVCRRSDRYDEWRCYSGASQPVYPG